MLLALLMGRFFVLASIVAPLVANAQRSVERESFAVMTAALDSIYSSHGDHPAMVIVADSLYQRPMGLSDSHVLGVTHKSKIDTATIADFEAKSNRSASFPEGFQYKGLIRFTAEESQFLRERGNEMQRTSRVVRLGEPFWIAFAYAYPNAWGVTYLSPVGLNESHSEALIFVRHECGSGCASEELIVLRKRSGRWQVFERINCGLFERSPSGSLRALGQTSRRLAILRMQRDSTRRAVADSMKSMNAPRRIRGLVVNEQTGRPIANAQIFIHGSTPLKVDSIWRVVADSRGNYVVRNPLIGGAMLELQCPGPAHRLGATLDAPGLYVAPGIDTVINLRAPNLEPCWTRRPTRPLISAARFSSGELTSKLFTESPFPSPREAEVYSALIHEFRLTDSTVVSANTKAWCGKYFECPRINVAHLERSGTIDPSTLRNFRKTAADTVRLNTGVIEAIGTPVLSMAEREYLENESQLAGSLNWPGNNFWSGLKAQHPGRTTILSLTLPGMSDSRHEAIVGYQVQRAGAQTAGTALLAKDSSGWHVLRSRLEDERISGAIAGSQCVPVAPGPLPTNEQLESIRGDFDFTLISSAVDNRVIRWRMRFLADTSKHAMKRPVFQVLSPETGGRLRSVEPGTYVLGGEQHFQNESRTGQLDGFGMLFVIRGVTDNELFGEWEHYSFGIPIGSDGKAKPEPSGHFCAKLISRS